MLWQWRFLEEDTVSQSSTLPIRCVNAKPLQLPVVLSLCGCLRIFGFAFIRLPILRLPYLSEVPWLLSS